MDYIWNNQDDIGVAGIGVLADDLAERRGDWPLFPMASAKYIHLVVVFCHLFDTEAMVRLQQLHDAGKHTVLCAASPRPHFGDVTALVSPGKGVDVRGDPASGKGALFVGTEKNRVVSVVNCGFESGRIHQAVRVARHLSMQRRFGMFDFNQIETHALASD
ncbi:MAG: hypothetical protein PHX68_04905 [Alphaproteobacteria bacterium]|nr:hypothetical protein [Alphaproteobacteria bacterium]